MKYLWHIISFSPLFSSLVLNTFGMVQSTTKGIGAGIRASDSQIIIESFEGW
jgi:hypothetical protein